MFTIPTDCLFERRPCHRSALGLEWLPTRPWRRGVGTPWDSGHNKVGSNRQRSSHTAFPNARFFCRRRRCCSYYYYCYWSCCYSCHRPCAACCCIAALPPRYYSCSTLLVLVCFRGFFVRFSPRTSASSRTDAAEYLSFSAPGGLFRRTARTARCGCSDFMLRKMRE